MAVRIFLQEIGIAYDETRHLEPYRKVKHFHIIQEFFGGRCCYCGIPFGDEPAVEDHLVPTNKTDLGLHAWGNIVPACRACNAKKQGADWRDFVIQRAGADAAERHKRMLEFLLEYDYKPAGDLRDVARELYEEVGEIAMTLVRAKIRRTRARL